MASVYCITLYVVVLYKVVGFVGREIVGFVDREIAPAGAPIILIRLQLDVVRRHRTTLCQV